jgi:hypothetical protein
VQAAGSGKQLAGSHQRIRDVTMWLPPAGHQNLRYVVEYVPKSSLAKAIQQVRTIGLPVLRTAASGVGVGGP